MTNTMDQPYHRSRQAEQQARIIAKGRCAVCWQRRPRRNPRLCDACAEKATATVRRRLGCKPWTPGSRGRPPKWYGRLVHAKGRDAANKEALRRAKEQHAAD